MNASSVGRWMVYCNKSKSFWTKLKYGMIDNLGYGFELTVCEVIFGIPDIKNPDIRLLHFLILMGKWYINNCRSKEKQIYFFEFLMILKNKVNIMIFIPVEDDLGISPWLGSSTQCTVNIFISSYYYFFY